MTIQEFDALPLEARRFIQDNAGCLSCGNKEQKLTKAYELYKNHKKMAGYRMRGGGVNYKLDDERGVLTNIRPDDEPDTIRHKIKVARAIYKSNPELFEEFNNSDLTDTLKGLPKEQVIDLDAAKKSKDKKEPEQETETEQSPSIEEL